MKIDVITDGNGAFDDLRLNIDAVSCREKTCTTLNGIGSTGVMVKISNERAKEWVGTGAWTGTSGESAGMTGRAQELDNGSGQIIPMTKRPTTGQITPMTKRPTNLTDGSYNIKVGSDLDYCLFKSSSIGGSLIGNTVTVGPCDVNGTTGSTTDPRNAKWELTTN